MGAFSGSVVSEVSRSYNSLSGTDIRAVIGNLTFAEIQAISYSITREKAPLYTMGSPDPRAFSRNKRGIAGSLVGSTSTVTPYWPGSIPRVEPSSPMLTTSGPKIPSPSRTSSVRRSPSTPPSPTLMARQRHHRQIALTRPSSASGSKPGHPLGLRPDPALRHHPGR